MPRTVNFYTLDVLSGNKGEIILETKTNTELHIQTEANVTTISLPFGNRFDIIGGKIVIYEKP